MPGLPHHLPASYHPQCLSLLLFSFPLLLPTPTLQNRVERGAQAKNSVQEAHLPAFLDLVVWGHEHECKPEPEVWMGGVGGEQRLGDLRGRGMPGGY